MDEEWEPWVQHDGSGCPVPLGSIVHIVWMGIRPMEEIGTCEGGYSWYITKPTFIDGQVWVPITRYRVKKSKGMQILKDLLQNLPAPTKELERV